MNATKEATVLIFVGIVFAAVPSFADCNRIYCGDSDGSCAVTASDALSQLRKVVGLDTDLALGRDDVTGDGFITVLDTLHTLRRVTGLWELDENYWFNRCPWEAVFTVESVDAWHALSFDAIAYGLHPRMKGAVPVRAAECRKASELDAFYFEYSVGEYGTLDVAFVTSGLEPWIAPGATPLVSCLVYPDGDDGDDTYYPFVNEGHAYFWPMNENPVEVPVLLTAFARRAMSPDWIR